MDFVGEFIDLFTQLFADIFDGGDFGTLVQAFFDDLSALMTVAKD